MTCDSYGHVCTCTCIPISTNTYTHMHIHTSQGQKEQGREEGSKERGKQGGRERRKVKCLPSMLRVLRNKTNDANKSFPPEVVALPSLGKLQKET